MITEADIDRELAHEEDCLNMGVVAYRNRSAEAVTKARESNTKYAKSLISRCIEPLEEAILKFLRDAETKPGKRHTAHPYLVQIDPDVAAFITTRVITDQISTPQTMTGIAIRIGGRIEDEISFTDFQRANKPLFEAVLRNLEKHPYGYQEDVRRSRLRQAAKKSGIDKPEWTTKEKLLVGAKLIELLRESTGLIQIVLRKPPRRGRHPALHIDPTDELREFIVQWNERAEWLCPFLMPTIIPPKPWSNPHEGGYYHPTLAKQSSLMKLKTRKTALSYFPDAYGDLSKVCDTTNRLQDVPWKVNHRMFEVVREVRAAGVEVKDTPSEHDEPIPAKPSDYETNRHARVEWKREKAKVDRCNRHAFSKRLQVEKILIVAEKMKGEPSIYFPHMLDFRGRFYALPQFLNPQGNDLARSLLTFAERKRLGKEGARWLAIHCANCFGIDKCTNEDRVNWTAENSSPICAVANDSLADTWWATEADKPWQFLAAAMEWAEFVKHGEDYESSLPITVDGSCNGIQHLSALVHDEVCGAEVNLIPCAAPADIYTTVASKLEARLKADTSSGEMFGGKIDMKTGIKLPEYPVKELAQKWLDYGICIRKAMKQPVMTLPYGGTRAGVRTHLRQYIEEAGRRNFTDTQKFKVALSYLAKMVWETMQEVLRGPLETMDWLRKVAKKRAKDGKTIIYTAPSGLCIHHAYHKQRGKQVKTKIGETTVKLQIREEAEDAELDARKQVQSFPANFVHSLDAAVLALTIQRCAEAGIKNFTAVHDAYGTQAADMPVLNKVLREVFAEMYSNVNILAQLLQDNDIDLSEVPLPQHGTLDLNGVLASEYFFS